jgi:type I restriction enzyme S subunit
MNSKSQMIIKQQLRFPSFRQSPKWVKRKLTNVLIEHNFRSTGKEEVFSVSVHKGVINQILHLGRSFSASSTHNYKLVLPGDIIYTKSPTGDFPYGIIKQSKVTIPVIVSPLYGVFSPETHALGYILDSYFESAANTFNYLSSIVQKGAKNTINITNEVFLSKCLYLPLDKDEQQKIADCLSSLDDLIFAQTKRLELLKKHKKGLMQVLFPGDREKVPKMRFIEFNLHDGWAQKALGELAIFLKGKGISKSDIVENGILECIRYGELYTYYKEVIKQIKSHTDISASELILSKVNDVIIPASGETKEDISSASCVMINNVALGGDLNIIRSSLNGVFLSYFLNSVKKQEISSLAQGYSVVHLYPEQLKKINIRRPSLEEQKKIADCLSSLDDLIAALTKKIELLKTHKKGLLQRLFPSPERA